MDPHTLKLAAVGAGLLALVLSLLTFRPIAHAPAAPQSLLAPSTVVSPAR